MATNKQIAAIKHQQAANKIDSGINPDILTTKEASAMLEKSGYKNGTVKSAASTAKQAVGPGKFNPIRFGLACKLVVQGGNIDFLLYNEETFIKKAKELYNLFSKAETAVSAASSSSGVSPGVCRGCFRKKEYCVCPGLPDDQDFRAEMAMKRQQEDAKC